MFILRRIFLMRPSPASRSYYQELSVVTNKGTMFRMVYDTPCRQATTKQRLCTKKLLPSNLLKAFDEKHFLEKAHNRCVCFIWQEFFFN